MYLLRVQDHKRTARVDRDINPKVIRADRTNVALASNVTLEGANKIVENDLFKK